MESLPILVSPRPSTTDKIGLCKQGTEMRRQRTSHTTPKIFTLECGSVTSWQRLDANRSLDDDAVMTMMIQKGMFCFSLQFGTLLGLQPFCSLGHFLKNSHRNGHNFFLKNRQCSYGKSLFSSFFMAQLSGNKYQLESCFSFARCKQNLQKVRGHFKRASHRPELRVCFQDHTSRPVVQTAAAPKSNRTIGAAPNSILCEFCELPHFRL